MNLFGVKRRKEEVDEDVDVGRMEWKENPEFDSNPLSGLVFAWMQPLFTRASRLHKVGKVLEQHDLAPLPAIDSTDSVEARFEKAYNSWKPKKEGGDKKKEQESQLIFALRHVCNRRLIIAGVIKFFNTGLQFSFPLLINAILKFLEDVQQGNIPEDAPGTRRYAGYWLSCLLLGFIASKAVTESAYFHKISRCGFQVKAAVSAAVYNKSLRLASVAQQSTTLGEMVNLMQVDATKIEAFVPQFHVLWDGIFQIAGFMTILGTLLGWPCIVGLVVMILAAPVMLKIMGKLFGRNRAMVKHTDERVKTVNEALRGIRCVKMYTWEDSFAKEISKYRQHELDNLKAVAYLRGFSRAYMTALPTVAAVATFLVYSYATNRPVTASTLFAALTAFDQLRFPLLFYPIALAQLAQAKVSLTRVAAFLALKEVNYTGFTRIESQTEAKISIQNATVYWGDPDSAKPQESKKELEEQPKQDDDEKEKEDTDSATEKKSISDETNAEFFQAKPILSDVTLDIASGDICAVVGRVGSGKSTLCAAMLNETVLSEGSNLEVTGKVAYVAQTAWIMNKSVRDNILFGRPFDKERYERVIKTCQLTHDLSLLDDGDLTEIGERGINLSGGQKQRISIARAAYSDANLIIMDDPLSALDPEVAKRVFEECIVGFMKDRTRVLVTNQLQCLPQCDSVVALGEGKILEAGTYEDLVTSGGEVQRLLKDLEEQGEADKSKEQDEDEAGKESRSGNVPVADKEMKKSDSLPNKEAKALTTKEEREKGAVKLGVYLKYLRSGGGLLQFVFVYFAFLVTGATNLMTTVWVSLWTSDANYERNSQAFYVGLYALTAVLLGVVTFVRSFLLAKFGVRASQKLHDNLVNSILKAPISFFDTTPSGRILSRFSNDMHTIDQELSEFFDFVLFMTLSVTITMGTIIYATPWFGLALLPIIIIYVRVLNYFREVSRETKRLESISRSPVYAHFSETLGGLSTIRAYGEANTFIDDFAMKLNESTKAIYNNKVADRWLAVRLELIGAVIAGLASIFSTQVALSTTQPQFASLAGISITYASLITGQLNWVVRMFAQVEAAMNSCERVFYYTENIPQEAPSTSMELEKEAHNNGGGDDGPKPPAIRAVSSAKNGVIRPSKEWPSNGAITLSNLAMRYRSDTPLVLQSLNVAIQGGERVGVVGRTGSGKSSLFLCLLRMVEPALVEDERYDAPITVDGVDILRVGLKDLRSKIGVIPQDPVLFSGTIRSNVDPFGEHTDEAIWSALRQCQMYDVVSAMPDGLLAPVAEYGENLSQGQRQLICLGRALLKNCRILLLDEATSSIDFETDREIQGTIRNAFQGSTVLTIAHRVDTIMDSDKILVMKDGHAAEFAPPQELLQNDTSLFSEIVRQGEEMRNGN